MKKIYLKCIVILFSITISCMILPSCNNINKDKTELNEREEGEEGDENDEYDGPDKAAEFERMRNMDPNTGQVSYNKMWDAVMQTENRKNTLGNESQTALAPLAWVERGSNSDVVGPSNGNGRPGGGVTSGRMRTVWVDLADPTGKTVWVGGISGGLWKTNDVTATTPSWILINDYLSNLAVSGITQDPTNTNTMYFCTGESYFTGGGVGGIGVFKSTDHGITWTYLSNTSTLRSCTKILCDAAGNVYVSTLGVGFDLALMRSLNGGTSWVNINPFAAAGVTQTSRIPDFEISSTGRMHVIGGFSSASATLGGYRYSDNPAAATPTWQQASTLFTWPFGTDARTELATVGNTIYASLGQAAVGAAGGKIEKIAKSNDGGDTWTTTDLTASNITNLNGGGQGGYSQGLTVDPSDPNTVIVGSLNLLKSVDGGITFNKISEWVGATGQYVHADIHNMAWYDNGNKLLVTTDGGLFYSTNKGTNFSDKNTGLRLKQFYGVAIHPTSTNYFLAGCQDNGTHQFNGPGLTSSVEVLGGDGGYTAIDKDEPQFQTGAYVYSNFRRSSNGGASWSNNGNSSSSGLFINPYDYDNNQNKVYAGYSAGQYVRWENPQSGFTLTPVSIAAFGTAQVAAATVSPYVTNRVYFGLTNGKVFQIDNADQSTPVVTDITPAGLAAGFVNSVNIGASDQNITITLANAFAAATTSIYTTTNGGTSWTGIDGNLPEMPVYWALYHPDGDTKMYIATETGVWSTDAITGSTTTWTAETSFPTVKTSMLKYRSSDRTIAAATYGRGLWTAIIPNTSCTAPTVSTQPVNSNICTGLNTTFTIAATGSATLTYQWQVSTAGAAGPWTNVTNNTIYTNATTNALTITAATATLNTYQYRCIVSNCFATPATSNAAILTVNATATAPTVVSPVNYCQGATAAALTATGTGLKWYTVATGGTVLPGAPTPSTAASGNTVYYVSQTNAAGCEGPRAAITVSVTATPPFPNIVNTSIGYCQGATATAIIPNYGANPGPDPTLIERWYAVSTGGTALPSAPIPSTAALGSTIYYFCLVDPSGVCEGPRQAVTVTITAVPLAPTVTPALSYCQGVVAPVLTATGSSLRWYTVPTGGTASTTAPIPNTTAVGNTTYYVSQTTGCESPRSSIVVTINPGTAAPTVTSTFTYCQNATAATLTATGASLLWYTTATSGTGSATAPIPSTISAGSTTYYVTQTVGACESPRAPILVNVIATPLAPTVTAVVNYCQNTTATALTATGTNLMWYTVPSAGVGSTTAPIPSTTNLGSTSYYVSQTSTVGACEGPRALITVNVLSVSPAPTVSSPVVYCQNATATPLTAVGTSLLWYTAAAGGTGSATAPTPITTSAGSTTFYVSQNSSCGESARTPITVTVNPTPASPTVAPLQYCQGTAAIAITAVGTNILWYTAASGGTGSSTAPIPNTTAVGTINYYATQSVLGCESPRALLAVTTSVTPVAPTVSTPITYCLNATAAALTATGANLKWYASASGGVGNTTAPVPLTNAIAATTYYVSQTTGTCEGPRAAIVVNVTAVTAAPTVTSPQAYCQGSTAPALTAVGTNLLWYGTATGGTGSATAPTISTASVGTTTYYVSQTGNCESARTPIVVNITSTPNAPTANTTISYCQGSPATALSATGTGLLWYNVVTGGTGSTTAPIPATTATGTTTYYVSQTTGVCEGPRTAITVTVTSAPTITSQPQDITSCTTSATFNVTATGTGLTYQWFLSTDGGTTYNPINGATTSTLIVNGLTAAQSTNKYRAVVSSGSCTAATSNSVTARVGTNPIVMLTQSGTPGASFNPYTTGILTTTVSPVGNYTYQWKRNNNILTNTSSFINKSNGLIDDFGNYIVTVTDVATGCAGVSNTIAVSNIEAFTNTLLVSPNPTRGLVNIRYYSASATTQPALTAYIFNEKGASLTSKNLVFAGRTGTATVDMTKYVVGNYIVVLRDAAGTKIGSAKVIKY
jgi:Ig-like domain CHU_C associated